MISELRSIGSHNSEIINAPLWTRTWVDIPKLSARRGAMAPRRADNLVRAATYASNRRFPAEFTTPPDGSRPLSGEAHRRTPGSEQSENGGRAPDRSRAPVLI